jgi:quinol monooxygenase YgiN
MSVIGEEKRMSDNIGGQFQNAANQDMDEKHKAIEGFLDYLASQGFASIDEPILQFAQARAISGRRDELLEVLKKFEPIAKAEQKTIFYGHFPDINDPDLVHSVQVYKNFDALCEHMRDERYMHLIDPVMSLSAPDSPKYQFGKCLFYHRGSSADS